MSIYTIGDLHLSFKENKPMDIFGGNWEEHYEKVKEDWNLKVKENDLVVLPGDFSWATYLKDTDEDFRYLNNLPGKKILLKGNHDYWWTTVTSMRKFLTENKFKNIDFLHNNSFEFENKIIVGTRGWSKTEGTQDDTKIINREILRLELSIKDGIEKYGENKEIIVFMHYPPIIKSDLINNEISGFIKVMKKYNINKCFYGHLHSNSIREAVEGEYYGINFKLVSADGLDFKLYEIQ